MKPAANRLPESSRHGFGGQAIDRTRPLSFRLNGRTCGAFAGDTVFSALLAAGIDTLGRRQREPVAFDESFAPAVVLQGVRDPATAMAMDRLPVSARLELRTLGPRRDGSLLGRLLGREGPARLTLGQRLDDPRQTEAPWLQLSPTSTIETDIAVVGGGLAGMSAALAAADAGLSVVLIERRIALGGDARFFGTVGEEEPPDATITRLAARIAGTPAITVLLGSDAFGLAGTQLRVHQVDATEGGPTGRVLTVKAGKVVLATGAAERLPVFMGNRMPRVVGAVSAFHRAERYGVWPAGRAVFVTPHNYGYRLAILAADAGVEVQRVIDTRVGTQSRFVDFAKATGITLAAGLVPRAVEAPHRTPHELTLSLAVGFDGSGQEAASLHSNLVVVAGGWQPRLTLWLMAGGRGVYDAKHHWLAAKGNLASIALAGTAAGYRSSPACMASGERAVLKLLRKPAGGRIDDPEVAAIYETPDDATPLAPWRPGRSAWLDRGASFTPRPAPKRDEASVMTILHTLSLGDIAASAELGVLPMADAGTVAQERSLSRGEIADSGWRVPAMPAPADPVPPYLSGRFGAAAVTASVSASDGRSLEAGCLLYPRSDAGDPLAAVGAVIGAAPSGGKGWLVYGEMTALSGEVPLFVRDAGGMVPVTLVREKPAAMETEPEAAPAPEPETKPEPEVVVAPAPATESASAAAPAEPSPESEIGAEPEPPAAPQPEPVAGSETG